MAEYRPYDDNTQVARKIERYPLSFTRNPSAPLIERPITLTERTGPAGLGRALGASAGAVRWTCRASQWTDLRRGRGRRDN